MRILSSLIITLLLTNLAQAQTLNEAKEHFQHQRYQRAENILHRVLSADASNSEAWGLLVRTYILQHQYEVAKDSLAFAPGEIKQTPFYEIASGTLLLENKNVMSAKDHFNAAIDMTKGKNVEVLSTVADVNIESPNGDYDYAVERLHTAIKRDKKNSSLYTSLGQAFRKKHNGTEAYKAFMEAIEKNKNEATAYYELGRLFLSQKNVELFTEYFNKAVAADPHFGPAYYDLYNHYLYIDPAKAEGYFDQYVKNSDWSVQQEYSKTDLLYLNKKYDSAIYAAGELLKKEGDQARPRLYKLISYSFQEKLDTASAFPYMVSYFQKEADSNFVVKDYETLALLYSRMDGKLDSAITYYKGAISLTKEPAKKANYFRELARLSKEDKRYDEEAKWLGQIYSSDPKANNVTLFNWGLAAYKAQDFAQADTVFGIYTDKYPEQGFGHYWRARANAAIDTVMADGLAVPHYLKLIEVVNKDSLSTTDKKWMKEAYGYLASYEANTEKDYAEAINYFEKLLVIDPSNEQVERNIEILEKNLAVREKADGESK